MLWAQVTLLALYFTSMLLSAYQHGKPKTGRHNFWASAIAMAMGFTIQFFCGAFSRIFHH